LLPSTLPQHAATIGGAEEAEVEVAPSLLVGEVPPELLGHLLERVEEVPPEPLGHLLERAVAIVVGVVVVGVIAGGSGVRAPTRRDRCRWGHRGHHG
jgi:hypothetical protein